MLRTVWIYAVGLLLTLVHGLRVILCPLLPICDGKRACDEAPRKWSRAILRLTGVEVEVEGEGAIDLERSQIVVSNHQSWFDVFALSTCFPGRFHFVAKEELARIPIFGRAWQVCGHIKIDRGSRSSAIESLRRAGEKIRRERTSIIMFPEGTRSPTGELQRFKKGAFRLALEAGVPIVPVAVIGSRDVMPKGRWTVRPGRIRIRFGAPIDVSRYSVETRDELLRRAWVAVAALKRGDPVERLEEECPPPAPPGPPGEGPRAEEGRPGANRANRRGG